ncbi:hemolysin family protein [Mycobacterium sp. ITM-2016-00318]|uniref:hemolysin family protein n=1 Tax=Mycobacterium sp. ITM-2016-00318 TaxID=2099693 RepID=UPI000CFA4D57|nr:hemolysin family protein [Mycobacterium sp. ITM-2016-00318]WNG91928.1 hemolysin family protein [Mycobacterium sp. ITM-2016-00318]
MTDPWVVLAVTSGLIALSALFVAIEFALLTARRHRLEDAAAKSRSARSALRSTSELSLLLAGSQLGITACTLALGATTKPAVHHGLTPLLRAMGAPLWLADAGGFVLALAIVTFLHLVIGEMAPKSWAIAHPERAATILAIPMRMFMALTRPVLIALNRAANWCVRKAGVDPIDELGEGQDPDTLRHLVEHSAAAGALDPRYYRNLATALELERLTVGDIVSHTSSLSTVAADAGPAAIQAMSRLTGHQRILVHGGELVPTGVVHVRDSLRADSSMTARELMRPVLRLGSEIPVYRALHLMRQTRNHLAVIVDADQFVGLITLTDVLQRLMPSTGAAA